MGQKNLVHQDENGKWIFKGMEFNSKIAAEMYAKSSAKQAKEFNSAAPQLPKWFKWLGIAIPCMVVLSCINNTGGKKNYEFDWADALVLCQNALKQASRDPEKASIPSVENFGKGDEYYFAWGAYTKMARMRNGLGLEVGVTASCIVSKSQKRIISMTLNGQSII